MWLGYGSDGERLRGNTRGRASEIFRGVQRSLEVFTGYQWFSEVVRGFSEALSEALGPVAPILVAP